MTDQDIKRLIEDQSISLPNSGMDRWPGHLMTLETDEVGINGTTFDIKLMAWYDLQEDGGQPKFANAFIIKIEGEKRPYIYTDFFYEAKAVWDYYIKIYPL